MRVRTFSPGFVAGGVTGVVYEESGGVENGAEFEFMYVTPAPEIAPVDGPTSGGTAVTVTLFWGVSVTADETSVSFGGVSGTVTQVLSSSADKTVMTVLSPASAGSAAGSVTVEVPNSRP